MSALIRPALVALTLVSALGGVLARAETTSPADSALQALNALRLQAGMEGFSSDGRLAAAALGHARYLLAQPGAGHQQRRGGTGFTGVEPLDRARAAHYPAMLVSENVAQGNTDAERALEGLMAAIYHRFGFLDFDVDSVGIGYAAYRNQGSSAGYVFLMGNGALARLCGSKSFEGLGQYVYSVCDPDIRIEKSVYEGARGRFGRKQPEVVVWPSVDMQDVPPAFFDESPDPLPDREVSGYPVSVSINPYRVNEAKARDFQLVDLDTGKPVSNIRRMDAASDPNHKLDAHQFAWFPLQRLQWGGRYQASVTLELDGRVQTRSWRFRVRTVPQPLYIVRVGSDQQAFVTDADGWLTVFVPPGDRRGVQRLTTLEYRYPQGASVQSEFLDGNTLRIQVRGKAGTKVRFETNGGIHFDVVLAAR